MSTNRLRTAFEEIEVPSWAPWLRFSWDELEAYQRAFPDGQVIHLDGDAVVGMLTSVRVQWDGDPSDLGTWDEVAGRSVEVVAPAASAGGADAGNTMVMLSVSVRADHRGAGVPAGLVEGARAAARRLGLAHLISPFRPSGFGGHKAAEGDDDFARYVASERDDGLPLDPWLRALTRMGMRPLALCPRAMVVEATPGEVDHWRATHRPDAWARVDDEHAAARAAAIDGLWDEAPTEVWECGETGAWFLDRAGDRAWYVEDNLWGEVPLTPPTPTDDDIVIDITDAALARQRDLDAAEAALVRDLSAALPGEAVAVAWIDPTHPHAVIVRAHEVVAFPDIEAFTPPEVDARCRFLAVVDLVEARVVHAFRVSSARFGPDVVDADTSGVPMVDEVVVANDGVTLDDVRAHYRGEGVDIAACVAVETNFRIVGGQAPNGLRWSDIGYVAVFLELMADGVTSGERGVFAHLNEAARQSLHAIGVEPKPFAGDPALRSPASQEGTHDERYAPAFIPDNDDNVAVFQALAALSAPSRRFVAEVDLRDRASDRPGDEAVDHGELQGVDGGGGDRQVADEPGREA